MVEGSPAGGGALFHKASLRRSRRSEIRSAIVSRALDGATMAARIIVWGLPGFSLAGWGEAAFPGKVVARARIELATKGL
jgi:hypothetical protein